MLCVAESIRQCLSRAAEERGRARETHDPERMADFLYMESRWLRLAEAYQQLAQMQRFNADATISDLSSHNRLP